MREGGRTPVREEGFEKTVDLVAAIERQLGIYDLDLFTPKMKK